MRLFDNLLASAPVRYSLGPDGQTPVATPMRLLERVQHLCDERFHVQLVEDNVRCLQDALRATRRMTPLEAQSSPLLAQVRVYEKAKSVQRVLSAARSSSSPRMQQLTERVTELSSRLLAARMGLTKEEMDLAPGLQTLAEKHRIYNYMARYNDTCQIVNGEVWIKQGGQQRPWSEVPAALRSPERQSRGQLWPYDATGLTDRSMDVWPEGKMQPFFFADPRSWGGGYVMSLCTSTLEEPRLMQGDHTWIRLYDPQGGERQGEGAIYAVGLYRPEKRQRSEALDSPLRVKPGFVRLDFSEFWGEPITELSWKIDREQFEAIRERIEQDHAAGMVPFQLVDQNCTRYALDLAEMADVQIEAQTSFMRLLLPQRAARMAQRIFAMMPRFIQALCLRISGLFWNLVQVKLGAARVDPAVSQRDPTRTNSFASLSHAIATSGSRAQELPTPWRLGQEITVSIQKQRDAHAEYLRQEIELAEREGNQARVQELQGELGDVRYWLPPENRGIRRTPSPVAGSGERLVDLRHSPLAQTVQDHAAGVGV
jgi:hypothetical protein